LRQNKLHWHKQPTAEIRPVDAEYQKTLLMSTDGVKK
jgi:hypothetical protein